MDRKNAREPSCVLCELQFSFKDSSNPYGARCPLLLQCGHSICEGCMRTISRGRTSVTCTVCSAVSETNKFKNPEELREEFPLNIYAVGQVSLKRLTKNKSRDSVIGFYSSNKKMTQDTVCCGECEVCPADCSCRQCNVFFCGSCFSKIHSVGVTLRRHEKILLSDVGKMSIGKDTMCNEHPEKVMQYYCNECTEYFCVDCTIKKHLKHECVDIAEKNEELLPEFSEAFKEGNLVLKQLYATYKKLQNGSQLIKDEESRKIEKQVTLHFSHLHGLLQLKEEQILKEIRDAQDQTSKSLNNIFDQLSINIKEMETILADSSLVMEQKNLNSVPLYKLLDKLKNVTAMPCHLILNNEQEYSNYKFSVDKSIIEMLEKHCTVSVPSKREYELRSKCDLPDNVIIDSVDKIPDPFPKPDFFSLAFDTKKKEAIKPDVCQIVLSTQPPQTEVKTKKTSYQDVLRKNRQSLNNNREETFSTSSTESAFENICKTQPLIEGTTEIVRMTHLVSPNYFYVNRSCTQNQREKLRDYFSKQANVKKTPPDVVELGQLYLVQFIDHKWYRAKVGKIKGNDCQVFYVDYGNTETVQKNKLREIPEKYITIPFQAIHCGLFGCAPVENKWSEEVFKFIATVSNNVDLSMYVERINQTSGFHEVHLRKVNDINGCFTEALVFLEYAIKTESTRREGGLYKPHMKTFYKDVGIKKGETFDGQVTHINTPTHFYIQRITDGGQLILQLMKDLNSVYANIKSDEQLIFIPSIGMPVAAKFSDGKWYRGIVCEIPKPRSVQVKYVDFGNVEIINWKDIRILDSKFLKIAAQGLKCALSDIAPKHPKGWPVSAKRAFEEMVKKKTLLRVYVEEIKENNFSIVLYETHPDKDICFNGLLVKKGYANSVGQSSAKSEYLRKCDEACDSDSESEISSVSRSRNQADKLMAALNFKQGVYQQLECERTSSTATSSDTTVTHEESEPEGDAYRIKVKILEVKSPGEIYVSFNHDQITRLSADMSKFYDVHHDVEQDWTVGKLCAVQRTSDNKWYRGLINEEFSDNKYEVFIKDILDSVVVDTSKLRKLKPEFTSVMDGSVRCHMSTLLPAGGRDWSFRTLEYLNTVIKENPDFLYISKLGELINNSLPVQLWRKQMIVMGALDPVREEWIDIGKTLIELGCALPNRKSEHYSTLHTRTYLFNLNEPSIPTVEEPLDYESNFPHQSNVANWLSKQYEAASSKSANSKEFEKVEDIYQTSSRTAKKNTSRKLMRMFPKQTSSAMHKLDEIKAWKPAEPFKNLDFIAIPTYVDNDCAVYLQDKEQSQGTLELIQKALMTLYQGSLPKPHDLVWTKGEICSAYYEPDGKWYRGRVMNVSDGEIDVLFVDYGNTEVVSPEQLRKQITMGQVPIQCHRCNTEGLYPVSRDGKWPIHTLDFVHAAIVTKDCRVCLKPPLNEGDEYVISKIIVTSDHIDLMDTLLNMNLATYAIDCEKVGNSSFDDEEDIIVDQDSTLIPYRDETIKITCPKTIENEQLHEICTAVYNSPTEFEPLNKKISDWYDMCAEKQLSYRNMIIPDGLVELSVEVTVVSGSTSLKVIISDCDDPVIQSWMTELKVVQSLINEEAEYMPIITEPVKGSLCIACFSEDHVWYRALIKDIHYNENLVHVLYVDYGNEEDIPIDRLRETKETWTVTPVQTINVTLFNVRPGPNYDQSNFQNYLMDCLTSPPYTMTVEARQPRLLVELYDIKGKIPYQSLIDLGFLEKIQ